MRTEESKARVQALVDGFMAERKGESEESRKARWAKQHAEIEASLAEQRISSHDGSAGSPQLRQLLRDQSATAEGTER